MERKDDPPPASADARPAPEPRDTLVYDHTPYIEGHHRDGTPFRMLKPAVPAPAPQPAQPITIAELRRRIDFLRGLWIDRAPMYSIYSASDIAELWNAARQIPRAPPPPAMPPPFLQGQQSADVQEGLAALDILLRWCDEVEARPAAEVIRPTIETQEKRFGVALSFPGERREFIGQVADVLAASVGRERVLYDKFHEAEFARPDLDTYLQRLYLEESELIAVFLCADYDRKEWCGVEWRAIREVIKRRQVSTVMPLRFDDTEIAGLFSFDGYVSIGDRTPEQVAGLILERLRG